MNTGENKFAELKRLSGEELSVAEDYLNLRKAVSEEVHARSAVEKSPTSEYILDLEICARNFGRISGIISERKKNQEYTLVLKRVSGLLDPLIEKTAMDRGMTYADTAIYLLGQLPDER